MRRICSALTAFIANMAKTAIFFIGIATSLLVSATDEQNVIWSKKPPLVIESQVKGSQEQPNVIYIMPWQGIENPISIEGNKQKIVLPDFKPINPKLFRKQAALFYQVNPTKQK